MRLIRLMPRGPFFARVLGLPCSGSGSRASEVETAPALSKTGAVIPTRQASELALTPNSPGRRPFLYAAVHAGGPTCPKLNSLAS